jgi:DNA-binding transcriptional LysR family regulator
MGNKSVPSLDNLQAMAAFVRVVESHSFTKAAGRLDTTPSSVSKRIALLEDHLGVRLLDRSTRRVALTDVGSEFYRRCSQILAEVEDAESAVSCLRKTPRGLLRVSGPVIFGELHLVPLVPEFLARWPEVQVDLSLNDRVVNIVDEGFDLAVRIGVLSDSSLVARKIARIRGVVCGSPAYLSAHGSPETPSDLVAHNCLRYTLVSAQQEWRFRGPEGVYSVPVRGTFQSNHGGAIRDVALGGVGLAHLPQFIVEDAIARGALRPILEAWDTGEIGVHCVTPPGRHPAPKVVALVDFLAEKLPPRLRAGAGRARSVSP